MLITIIFKNNVAIEESSSPHNLAKQGEISAKFCFELAKQLCFELRLVNPTQLHNTYYILFVLCSDLLRFLNIISSFFHSIWHAVFSLLAIRNFGGLPIYSWSRHKELWFIFRHSCFELFLYYLCSIQCENTKLENYGSNSIKQGQSHQIMKKNSFQYKKPTYVFDLFCSIAISRVCPLLL